MRDTELANRIMKEVRCMYILNRYCSATLCRVYMLVAFLSLLLALVSLPSIYANLAHPLDVRYASLYLMRAFWHTEFVVQMLTAGLGGLSAWLLLDAVYRLWPSGLWERVWRRAAA